MEEDTRIRLLKLMLYREAGGTGYELAIDKLAKEWPDFYYRLQQELKGIKDDVAA
jgi:hypothetical protein